MPIVSTSDTHDSSLPGDQVPNPYLDFLDAGSGGDRPRPPRNPYLDALERDDEVALSANLHAAARTNADQYAKAAKLGEQRNIPPDTVYRNLQDVEIRQAIEDADNKLKTSPRLAAEMRKRLGFARIAHDDVEQLSTLETLVNSFKRGVPALKGLLPTLRAVDQAAGLSQLDYVDTELAAGRAPDPGKLGVIADQYARMTPQQRAQLRATVAPRMRQNAEEAMQDVVAYQAERQAIPLPDVVNRVMAAKSFGEAASAAADDPVRLVAAIGPESLVQSAPGMLAAIPATVAAGPAGAALTLGGNSALVDYAGTLVDVLQSSGVDVTNPAAVRAALRDRTLLGKMVNQAGRHAAVVGAVDAVSGGIAGKMLLPGGGLRRELANIALQVPIQGGLGALGEAGGELAAGQPLQPGQILAEALGEMFGTPGEVVVASGKRVAERVAKARKAREDAAALEQIAQAAEKSKLRTRDGQELASFVDGDEAAHVYLSAQVLAQEAQAAGVDLDALAAAAPSVAGQLREALATGGDLEIPVGEFAAHIAGTPLAQRLLPHLRAGDPEALTLAEAETFNQDEMLRAEVDTLLQSAAPATEPAVRDATQEARDAVRALIAEQLDAAGRFTPDVNRSYADMLLAFVATTAERAGVPVQQFFEQYGPRIVSHLGLPAQVDGGPVVFDSEEARQGAAQPADGQPLAQGRRGAYEPTSRTIALLEHADLSTFIHESGHYFLETFAELASQPTAPAQVRADMATVLQWFGVTPEQWRGMSLEQKRTHHERFARGFEAYAREGDAPSPALVGVFRRFRAWLMRLYRELRALNVELTPEVRAIFDRMLASDEEISARNAQRGLRPLFESAQAAGMTPEEFSAYQATGELATTVAVEDLARRSVRDLQWVTNAKDRKMRQLRQDAAKVRDAIEAEVVREVMALPLYRARKFLMHGVLPVGSEPIEGLQPVKLSRAVLKFMYGEKAAEIRRRLPQGQNDVTSDDPNLAVHPDVVAHAFGLSSGDELVQQLIHAEKPEHVVEALTDQRMLERFGELSDARAIERAAEEAIHNDVRARFLEREVNQLAKAVGSRPILTRAARAFAEESLARRKVRDIRPALYRATEARAGREAERAFKSGDTAAAAARKREQLLNHQLARVADAALSEVEKAVNYLRGLDNETTRKAIGPDYAEQIDALLERYDLRKSVTGKTIARRQSLLQWVEEQRELGFEPVIAPELLEDAQSKHYTQMTLEELRGLVDAVRNVEHLGRLKQKLLTVQDQRAFDEIVTAASASIREKATKTIEQKVESQLPADRARKLATQFLVSHRKMASLVRQMDGGQDGGPLWSILVRPMNAAGDREAVMRADATAKLSAIFVPLNKAGDLYHKKYIGAVRTSLTRAGRLAVALNWGNEANRQRVLDGERWSVSQVEAVLDTLSREDWDFVQAIWDYLDSYWPQIAAKEKRVSGVEPEKVPATPVRTKFGELRGGYYPIKYDTDRSSRAESDTLAETVKQAMQGLYTRATTRRGHTKARAEAVNRPVRKDLGVIFEHVEQVAHDLSWHEYLIDANRLLRARGIDDAIRTHYGPEVLRTMSAALQDIAAGDVPAQSALEHALNHLRAGVSISAMGWSVITAAMQPLGLTQSAVRIGPQWVARGVARWLGGAVRMEGVVREIHAKSEFMRLRDQTMNREINEIRNRVQNSGGRSWTDPVPQPVKDTYWLLMQKMQMVVDVPTWLGAYEKAQAAGDDEAKAIAMADQAVIDSQGSGHIKELAAVQRGGPLQKLLTSFYSYFSTTFNLTAEAVGRTRFSDPASVARLAVDFLMLYTVPAVLGALLRDALRGRSEDDGDELAKKLLREQANYLLGTMVGVRELSAMVSGTFGYSGPAGTRFFSDMANLSKQAAQGEVDKAALKAANHVAGTLLHYPALQVERVVEGMVAVTEGDAGPQALLFGVPPTP